VAETVNAKYRAILAKAITNKQSYRSKPWRVNYDSETDTFKAVHYGTTILTFALTHQLENGHYAKLGGGWSMTDKGAIDAVLRHVYDVHGLNITRLTENFVNSNKFYTKQHYAIFDRNQHGQILAIEKDPTQKTLYAFEPFKSKRQTQVQKLQIKRAEELAILEKQIELEIKAQLEYLRTHENANIALTENGFKVSLPDKSFSEKATEILIAWNGDVYDLHANQRVCVQIDTQQNFKSAQELGLTPLDLTLSKALGIALKPSVLNEGVRSERHRENLPSIVEVLREEACYDVTRKIDSVLSELNGVEEVVYEQKRKRERFKTKVKRCHCGWKHDSPAYDIESLISLGIKREYVTEWLKLRDSISKTDAPCSWVVT